MVGRNAWVKTRGWLLPGAMLALIAAAFWLTGDRLSYSALHENREALEAWREENTALAVALFAAVYIGIVAFSVPGAIWLTLIGGFLFGVAGGAAVVTVSATIGATLIFLAARTILAAPLRRQIGPRLARLERGFRAGEASYLLIMRLLPAVPFWIANLAPAFLGARTWTFIWTTFLGIVPGTLVSVSIGAGLGELLEEDTPPDLGLFFEPHILWPLLGLAALSVLPVILRGFGIRRPGAGPAD